MVSVLFLEENMKKICAVVLSVLMFQANFALAFNKGDRKMTREDVCKKNYEVLFNSEWKPNEGLNSEFMDILQKYIFGEVFTVGKIDIKTREMLTVVSLSCQQTLPQLKSHINAALNIGVKPVELREAIYQCAPFIGFPKTLNAISVLSEVLKERNIDVPLEKTATVSEDTRFEKGNEIQQKLYGSEIREDMKGIEKNIGDDVSRFLTEFCFGDIYTRKGLDIKTRELIAIGILVTNNNTQQLKSHIKGAIKAGNSKEEIASAIVQCLPYVGFPNALNALRILKEV